MNFSEQQMRTLFSTVFTKFSPQVCVKQKIQYGSKEPVSSDACNIAFELAGFFLKILSVHNILDVIIVKI